LIDDGVTLQHNSRGQPTEIVFMLFWQTLNDQASLKKCKNKINCKRHFYYKLRFKRLKEIIKKGEDLASAL
jgi:hypothetical protein